MRTALCLSVLSLIPARPTSMAAGLRAYRGAASSGRGRAHGAGTASPSSSAHRRRRRPLQARSGARPPSRPGRNSAPVSPPRARAQVARPSACRAPARAAGAPASTFARAETPAGRAPTPAAEPTSDLPGGNAARTRGRIDGSPTYAFAGAGWARRTRNRSSVCTRLSHLHGRLEDASSAAPFRRHSAGPGGAPVSLQSTLR